MQVQLHSTKSKSSNGKNNLLTNYRGKNSQVHILLLNNIKFILQKEKKTFMYMNYTLSVFHIQLL